MNLQQLNYRDQAFTSTQKVVTVFLQKSKMDPFRQGHTIKIYATATSTCPAL